MRNQAELPLLSFRFTSSYVSFLSPSADCVVSRYDLKCPRQRTRDSAFRLSSLLPHAFSSLRDRGLGFPTAIWSHSTRSSRALRIMAMIRRLCQGRSFWSANQMHLREPQRDEANNDTILTDIGERAIKLQLPWAAGILHVTTAHDRPRIDPHRGSGELWSLSGGTSSSDVDTAAAR